MQPLSQPEVGKEGQECFATVPGIRDENFDVIDARRLGAAGIAQPVRS
jgi:hypothetical protein